jgi:dTDP-4-amino-4,6-dideoxygalactose transaminase
MTNSYDRVVNARIPFLDLKKQYLQLKAEVLAKLEEVLDSTSYTGGRYVEEFEQAFAQYCQLKYAVGVNNGTSALHLAMVILGIGKGDEVIVPANTFIASAWAVTYTGATPVFVDCHPGTWQIDAQKIEEKITPRTKAIIGVHLYGQPFDIDAVKGVADTYDLFLVEDAAQAHGAAYKGKRVGSFGEMACFSFYPGKNLGTYGEGGAITTPKKAYAQHLQRLRNNGSTERYYHDEVGFNMRMGSLEAAVLSVKLPYLDEWNSRRKQIAHRYQQEITNTRITLQQQPDFAQSVYHLFVVTTPDRAHLMQYLNKRQIFPGLHYPLPCHLQKAYTHLGYQPGDLPEAEYLASHCLSLPMYAELTDGEVEWVIDALNKYVCPKS